MAGSTGVAIRVVSNRLPEITAAIKPAVVAEVSKSALQIQARAQALSPVLTGTLRRSIHTIIENGGLRGIVGPSVEYGKFVEFGTRFQPARPYMRPAAASATASFVANVRAALAGLK
jgi:HK97 gp10 family phage protein